MTAGAQGRIVTGLLERHDRRRAESRALGTGQLPDRESPGVSNLGDDRLRDRGCLEANVLGDAQRCRGRSPRRCRTVSKQIEVSVLHTGCREREAEFFSADDASSHLHQIAEGALGHPVGSKIASEDTVAEVRAGADLVGDEADGTSNLLGHRDQLGAEWVAL